MSDWVDWRQNQRIKRLQNHVSAAAGVPMGTVAADPIAVPAPLDLEDAPGYWLTPATEALSALARPNGAGVEAAITAAIARDPARPRCRCSGGPANCVRSSRPGPASTGQGWQDEAGPAMEPLRSDAFGARPGPREMALRAGARWLTGATDDLAARAAAAARPPTATPSRPCSPDAPPRLAAPGYWR